MNTKLKDEVSRRAPSLAEMGVKLREGVKADVPALRASTVAQEVRDFQNMLDKYVPLDVDGNTPTGIQPVLFLKEAR